MNKIKVIITNKQEEVKIPTGLRLLVRRCCIAVLKLEKFEESAEVSVTFVDNNQIRELNKKYRNKDVPTDVLSFPTSDDGNYTTNQTTGARVLGDVVISLEKAVEQAERFDHSFKREVGYLTVHSVLHLLGYDHEGDRFARSKMREKEEIVMRQVGLPGTTSYSMFED